MLSPTLLRTVMRPSRACRRWGFGMKSEGRLLTTKCFAGEAISFCRERRSGVHSAFLKPGEEITGSSELTHQPVRPGLSESKISQTVNCGSQFEDIAGQWRKPSKSL